LVNRPPPPPTSIRPDLPPYVDAWFARALHREPARRFASAREMSLAFRGDGEPLVDVGSITSLGDGTAGQFGTVVGIPPTRRWNARLAAGAVLAAVALSSAAIFVLAGGASEPLQKAHGGLSTWIDETGIDERLATLYAPAEVVDLDGASPAPAPAPAPVPA